MADIIITEFMDAAAVDRLRGVTSVHHDPDLWDRPDAIAALLGEARAIIVRNKTQVTAGLLAAGPKLKAVGRLGVGLDNIDLDAAAERGVAVLPATGANAGAVAEYVIATAMMLRRGAYAANAEVIAGTWPREALMGREVAGAVLGLVGFGSIGRETAARAMALGLDVIAHDPAGISMDGVEAAGFEDLLSRADIVSLHVPLIEATRGLIGETALAAMKPGAVLIDTARGGIVDEPALCAALVSGHLGGAALDVFEEEPLGAEAGARFRDVPNLVLTPHIAGITHEANTRVSALTAENVLRVLGGQP